MRNNIKELAIRCGDDMTKNEDQFFHEMLIINYARYVDKYNRVKENYKSISDTKSKENWSDLYGRVGMLIQELSTYLEIVEDFKTIESLYRKAMKELTVYKDKHAELTNKNVEKVGFFNSVPKDVKLMEYGDGIKKFEKRTKIFERLLRILSKMIIEIQIPLIKERKKERFGGAVQDFAKRKIQELKSKQQFWHEIVKENGKETVLEPIEEQIRETDDQ